MDTVTKFVLYHPEGKMGEGFPAFVCSAQKERGTLTIYILTRRTSIEVIADRCIELPAHKVRGGLIGVCGHTRAFGSGFVTAETTIDSLLHVELTQGRERSGYIPITAVRFACAAHP